MLHRKSLLKNRGWASDCTPSAWMMTRVPHSHKPPCPAANRVLSVGNFKRAEVGNSWRAPRRMVKELDLFESNHGCGLNGFPGSHRIGDVQNWGVTSCQGPSKRVG